MTTSLLDDAFGHHTWATLQLIDACAGLTDAQLEAPVPGTYGSILDTLRHLVRADTFFLALVHGEERPHRLDTTNMGVAELRPVAEANGQAWALLLRQGLDPDQVMTDVDAEGVVRRTAVGVLVTQALHHGNDHRSQLCTALTSLGVQPPRTDGWDYGAEVGRMTEEEPPR